MNLTKLIILICSLSLSTSLWAASDLYVSNNSGHRVSFKINNRCTSVVAQPDVTTLYPAAILAGDCAYSPSACTMLLFNKELCNGINIGRVTVNVNSGIISYYSWAGGWTFGGKGFSLMLIGPR